MLGVFLVGDAAMKTKQYAAPAKTHGVIPTANILKNHRQFQTDISNNIQHWISLINFNAQSIVSKSGTDPSATETLAWQIVDACMDLESFTKSVFRD